MAKTSRLKRVRADYSAMLGCIGFSLVILGTVGFRHLQTTNQQAEMDRQAAAAKQAEDARRKERDRGWIAWRDYAEPLCNDTLPVIKEGLDVTGSRRAWMPGKPLAQEGLIVCDRLRVGIIQRSQNRLRITYVVPKRGFTYPLPTSDPPPPEFAPSQPNQ